MKVELIGAIDFKKLASFLDKRVGEIIEDSNLLNDYLDVLEENNDSNVDTYIKLLDNIINYLENNSQGKQIPIMTKILNAVTSNQRKDILGEVKAFKEDLAKGKKDVKKDFHRLRKLVDEQIKGLETIRPEVVDYTEKLETKRRAEIVATAGKLSRFDGTIFDILEIVSEESLEENCSYANFVSGTLKHDSISDHDYVVFGLQDISILIEQIIIAERFSSFTIKSRRLVDFSEVGYYVPDFHDKDGNVLKDNKKAKEKYIKDMDYLFNKYSFFVSNDIPLEDSRYVLPYCYHSNIIMGVDAHVLRDMIIKFTKTKYAKIQEVREFGERLYEIAKEKVPYIIPAIDKVKPDYEDSVGDFIREKRDELSPNKGYKVIDKPKLIARSNDVDDTILISGIMRYTQYSYDDAKALYEEAVNNDPSFKEALMRLIFFKGDQNELAQISFEFQIGISFAVLTHYTRHRTHPIMVPDFFPLLDIYQFIVPPTIENNEELKDKYVDIFTMNEINRNYMRDEYGIRDEDLVYYTLAGNRVNIVTRFDGKTFTHIDALRECNRAQWASRDIALGCHEEISKLEDAKLYSSLIGSTCETQDLCREGKQCCGKIYELRQSKEDNK